MIIAKPTGYTVDTGNAKCPDHLWMLDEASGLQLFDQGKSPNKIHMDISNAIMRAVDASLGTILNTSLSPNYVGYSAIDASVWSGVGTLVLVGIVKPANATSPAVSEVFFGVASSTTANAGARLRSSGNAGVDGAQVNVTDNASVVASVTGADIYTGDWKFFAAKIRIGAGQVNCAVSVDGSPWGNDINTTLGALTNNRYGIGCRPGPAINQQATASHLAAFSYEGVDWATIDDAWIADLYANPWQFLSGAVTTTSLQVDVHPDAVGATGIAGAVFVAPAGAEMVGEFIGEFTGAAFDTALAGGLARLKVPTGNFGGDYLEEGTPLVVVLQNSAYTTGVIPATVVAS